jgi:predicted CXXCH cytochrome family protein
MQEVRPGTVLGRFDSTRFTSAGVTSTFSRRGERYVVNTEGADGRNHDFGVRYTFGVFPLQQYLVELSGGRIQPLPLAWDSRDAGHGGQRWFNLNPGPPPRVAHTDELHWTGPQQNWNYMCADCHSTAVRKGYDAASGQFRTTWSEANVSCEACHGPGSAHEHWASYPAWLRTRLWRDDGLPAHVSRRDRQIETCAQCHSRRDQIADGYTAGAPLLDYYAPSLLMPGLFYADGQQRAEVYTYASFVQSRMYHAGVTCANCHDPHTEKLRKPGNQVCTQCHVAAKYDTSAHHFHKAGGGTAGASCVSCHMPSTTYMLIDPRRDHSFRVPRPDRTVSLGVPNACNMCHTDRDARWAASQVRAWYGAAPAGAQRFAEAFAADERDAPDAAAGLAAVANDSTEPEMARASAMARLAAHPGATATKAAEAGAHDPSALVRRAALEILDESPAQDRIRVATPLLEDRYRSVRLEAAWVLAPASAQLGATQRGAFARAAEEFVASQRYNADRAENRVRLGIFFARLGGGRDADAIAEYRAALRVGPRYAPAYVNLADLLRVAARDAEAEQTLRAGITAVPGDPTLHHALGLLLARAGRRDEAATELGRAASLAPDDARFAYVYAVALNSTGRVREAIRELDRARLRHPDDRDLLFALATFHRDAGQRTAALRYATLLVTAHPDDAEARALMQSLQSAAKPH